MREPHTRIAGLGVPQVTALQATPKRSLRQRLRRVPWVPLGIIATVIFVALFAPLLTPHSPTAQTLPHRLTPPAWQRGGSSVHILGTDTLGRDSLSRLFYGARVTLIVASAALLIAGGVGLVIGILSGYLGGSVDTVLSRTVDASLAFPTILIALLFAVTLGQGVFTVILAIGLVLWARVARVIRGEVVSLRQRDFVIGAVAVGCSPLRIMARHILPMVVNTFLVLVSLNIGYAIVVEATLSFLGAGIPPPTPTWGQMVSEGRAHITSAWWLSIVPGAAITLLVLAFNVFGDWLRDQLDPTLRHVQ